MLRKLLCLFALIGLSGCRLDVTQAIDVTAPGREVIIYRETFDDEAFAATTQLGGPYADMDMIKTIERKISYPT